MIRFAENLNKMITAGLGGALEAPRTEVAVGHCIRYLEASGPVASFESNIAAPIRSLRVDMQPIQDLHGYDHPWPAGGGANLLPPVLRNNAESLTNNGVTLTIVNQKFHLNGTGTSNGGRNVLRSAGVVLPAGTYTLVGSAVLMYADTTIISNTVFTLTEEAEVYIGFNIATGTVYNEDREIAIVKGDNTATAWSPYENICPITGWDAVAVYRSGADMSDPQTVTIQLGQTVYGGTLDLVSGKLTVDTAIIASYNGEELPGEWLSDRDSYTPGTTPTTGAQVCYKLSIPVEFNIEPTTLSTLAGENNIWSDAGDVTLEYPYYEETEGY